MTPADTRIAVVGAGLAGMTVAGLLQRAGFPVAVYEQAPFFARIGAGIILSANAIKVLRRLDLEAKLVATAIAPAAFVSRAWDTGATTYRLDFDVEAEARFGAPFLNVHRADLHKVLETALTPGSLHFGHSLVGLEQRADHMRLTFGSGQTAVADIVIGADGIRSVVREFLFGAEPPRYTGRIAQRAIFPTGRILGGPIDDCTKWWGEDRHILSYFMTSRRDEVYLMGAVPAPPWEHEETSRPGSRDDFIAAFAHFHPDLRRILEAAQEVNIWPICDRPRNDTWSTGNVVLMGDACHAVRPYMAAGGVSAIEDAAILARCIARFGSPAEAFRCYEATRIPRVAEVQRISIENSWMHHDAAVDWFFGYDACSAPLTEPR
ncbi:MAG: 6-hydroxynicotinate 3-monooxygenase [Hyphomicrobiales bacterium]|nr:MAG: 6-hydroxynicotinate 3-monooxygenase [Hyphomicrobiales bacterium]